MTTLIIKSDSENKTNLMLKLAGELGLNASVSEFVELDTAAMAAGIGRKATNDELLLYLLKDQDGPALDLDEAFSKYLKNH